MNLQGGCASTLQKSSAFNLEMKDKARLYMLNNEIYFNNY